MSMLSKFGPKKTRQKGDYPTKENEQDIKNPARFHPASELLPEVPVESISKLVDNYKYNPDNQDKNTSGKELETIRNKNENRVSPESIQYKCPTFNLRDILPKCEEALLFSLYKPQPPKLRKLTEIDLDATHQKLSLVADYTQEIEMNSFKDVLYYFEGEVLIMDTSIDITGFLREYFNIEKVNVLYPSGEIKLMDSLYCNFWFKERLDKIFNGILIDISHNNILTDNSCHRCIYNTRCAFKAQ